MEKINKIVVFTDCYDIAYNEIYVVLSNALKENGVLDVTLDPPVAIKPFSIVNASFSIRLLADHYPCGTLFLVIMNATSKNPARIFGKTKHGITFVGNNSGYFGWLIEDFGLEFLYENQICRSKDGRSFGGKYVQVPTAAKLVAGAVPQALGLKRESSFLYRYPIAEGTVVHCDNFGLMKIKAPPPKGIKDQQKLKILINGRASVEGLFSKNLKTSADGTWVVFQGSSLGGLPELGKVRSKHSADALGVQEGDQVTWEEVKG
ncbi:MAG: SAM-dependent chlorinase/fluorinase [Chlamydiia bacterium]|nr:SAM-dependent chlorinase/fluorinase [Chlamydiia bacterium]